MFLPVQEANEATSTEYINAANQSAISQSRDVMWWLRITIYTLFVLSGQSAAMLLGRLYYNKGGKSKWLATLVQVAGFPILIPYYCISSPASPTTSKVHSFYNQFSGPSHHLLHLACNFKPMPQTPMENLTKRMKLDSYAPLVRASDGYGLMLSLTQLSFQKVLKGETFTVVLEMIIYQSLVATCATLVGIFASGDWKGLKRDMEDFELGKFLYVSTLIWAAIAWQIFTIGTVGLIHEVSSLFSSDISALGLPVIPVLAVIFFHDEMDGVKAIAMVLAIWSFISYFYQHYLDDSESKAENRDVKEISMLPLSKEVIDEQDGCKKIYLKVPLSTEENVQTYEH
ncbi:hypothetical protein FH972_000984 [Carpinus fangiana]|uniref:Probable purine permease n=1 Tax=Carpinus fangiana TaxID=176857 RepID=A0A5N6QC69_9ROSI|nr:hypothetical protein FH972_000984 [Carpinus fangiana]